VALVAGLMPRCQFRDLVEASVAEGVLDLALTVAITRASYSAMVGSSAAPAG
jgi:hypothetical protein